MSQIQVNATFRIHDGKLGEFKRLAAGCVETVREKDSGTLQYEWYFNADETICVVRETYRDSAAVLEHIGNQGAALEDLFGTADVQIEAFGEPSQELLDATAEEPVDYYRPFLSA